MFQTNKSQRPVIIVFSFLIHESALKDFLALLPIGIIGKCDGVVTMRRPAPVTGQQTREIGKSVPGLSEEEIDALVDDGVLQVPAEDPQR